MAIDYITVLILQVVSMLLPISSLLHGRAAFQGQCEKLLDKSYSLLANNPLEWTGHHQISARVLQNHPATQEQR